MKFNSEKFGDLMAEIKKHLKKNRDDLVMSMVVIYDRIQQEEQSKQVLNELLNDIPFDQECENLLDSLQS